MFFFPKKASVGKGVLWAFMSVITASLYTGIGNGLFEVMTPAAFAFVESVTSLIILLFIYGAMPEWKKLRKLDHKQYLILIFYALIASLVAPFLFYWGWSMTLPNNVFLLGRSEMLFTAILAAVWLREKVTVEQIIGIIIMFLGIFMIAIEGKFQAISIGRGELIILLSCIIWAVASVIYKKHLEKIPMELILIIRFFISSFVFIFLFAFFIPFESLFLKAFTIQQFLQLIIYSVVTVIIAKFCMMKAMKAISLILWSAIALSAPIFGFLFNYLLLGEIPEIYHYAGGGLIVLGFGVLQIHIHRTKTHHHLQSTTDI